MSPGEPNGQANKLGFMCKCKACAGKYPGPGEPVIIIVLNGA